MKKILLTSIASLAVAGLCGNAFGQGQIIFENASSSSTFIKLAPLGSTSYAQGVSKTGSGLVTELFWNNGSSYVLENTFTSTYTGIGQNGQGPGQFTSSDLTLPTSGTESFYIEAFYTSNGLEYSGTSLHFTASANTVPPGAPGHTDTGGSWVTGGASGDLILTPVPEPATLALGGLGAAALLLFRRRK